MGNSSFPTFCDTLNIMTVIHLRKLIAALVREDGQRDAIIDTHKDVYAMKPLLAYLLYESL
jgi:hypothetical protein